MRKTESGENTTYTAEDRAIGLVHNLYVVAAMNTESLNERKKSLQDQKETLNVNSYAYKEATKELNMLKKLGEPYAFYLTGGWREMFDFIEPGVTVIFLATLIILGVTPVFANEYANRTAGLVLATKHGKRKIVTVKMIAIQLFFYHVLRSEEHTSELQSRGHLVCRLVLETIEDAPTR